MQFNINHNVRVRLTDEGRRIHRANFDRLFGKDQTALKYIPPEEDADGWSQWQMWTLMREFGREITMGHQLPFETTIELVEPF